MTQMGIGHAHRCPGTGQDGVDPTGEVLPREQEDGRGPLPAWRLGTHLRDSQPLASEQTGHNPKKAMGSCHMIAHMRLLSPH